MKNWFGIEAHTTDQYIHWSIKEKDRPKRAAVLREAYSKFTAEQIPHLKILLAAAYQSGADDEMDANAGEDL